MTNNRAGCYRLLLRLWLVFLTAQLTFELGLLVKPQQTEVGPQAFSITVGLIPYKKDHLQIDCMTFMLLTVYVLHQALPKIEIFQKEGIKIVLACLREGYP